MLSSNKFSDDFKRDAVAQITERGYPARAHLARAASVVLMAVLTLT